MMLLYVYLFAIKCRAFRPFFTPNQWDLDRWTVHVAAVPEAPSNSSKHALLEGVSKYILLASYIMLYISYK